VSKSTEFKISVFCLSVSFLLMLFGVLDSAAFTQLGPVIKQEDPALAALIEKVGLEYRKGAPEAARVEELRSRVKQAYRLAGIERFSELREQAILLILRSEKGFEWETLRSIDLGNGERAGVWLTVPVWVPKGAQAVPTYGAPVARWEAIHSGHRFAGNVFLPPSLTRINDKRGYEAATLTFETFRWHAPFAYLLFDFVFREGWLNPAKRVPVVSVRCGEDTYAAAPRARAGTIPCFDFKNPNGGDFVKQIREVEYTSVAEVYHGHHARESNHRLGCALDINDINCESCKDGSPNPISRAPRQFARERMHQLDARNLPYWVYGVAEQIGYRVPYQWHYGNGFTDWQHLDCGKLDMQQWENLHRQVACERF
jgi:hypothetical protein